MFVSKIKAVFIIIISLGLAACATTSKIDLDTIPADIKKASQALVYLKSGNHVFNGVLISKQGIVLSVSHGINNSQSVFDAYLMNDTKTKATVIYHNPQYDFAVLQLAEVQNISWVELSNHIAENDLIYSIGREKSLSSLHISQGYVANEDFNVPHMKIINTTDSHISVKHGVVHTAHLEKGYSGGLLVNSEGKLIAINSAYFDSEMGRFSIAMKVQGYDAILAYLLRGAKEPEFPDLKGFPEQLDFLLSGLKNNIKNKSMPGTEIELVVAQLRIEALAYHKVGDMTDMQLNIWVCKQFISRT